MSRIVLWCSMCSDDSAVNWWAALCSDVPLLWWFSRELMSRIVLWCSICSAGVETSGQMRNQILHAVVTGSTFGSKKCQHTWCSVQFGSWDVEKVHAVTTLLWREAHLEVKMYKAHRELSRIVLWCSMRSDQWFSRELMSRIVLWCSICTDAPQWNCAALCTDSVACLVVAVWLDLFD